MQDCNSNAGEAVRIPSPPRRLLGRLGWGHRGFRVGSSRAALLGLLLLLLLPFIGDQIAFQERMRQFDPDLKGWLETARVAFDDPSAPIYTFYTGFYIYPPFFLTLIRPLNALPVPVAAFVFETLKWVALVVAFRLAWRLSSPPGEDMPPIVALGSLLMTWRFIESDLAYGNVNIFVLAAVLGGALLVARRRYVAGGALVAVAACIKVTPALLLVYFVYKGWWRTLLGAAAAVVVCLVIWPALCFGWHGNLHLLGGWYDAVVAGFIERGAVRSEHTNQALVGILNRLFGGHPSIFATDPSGPHVYLTLVLLPQWVRAVLRGLLTLGVLGALGWMCRGRVDPGRARVAYAAEVGGVLVAMLLLSGLSWKSHFVTMLLPYSVLLGYLADVRYPDAFRRGLELLLAASFVLCTLTSDIITPTGANYAEALGLIALGAILAAVGLGIVRERLRGEAHAGASGAIECAQ